MNIKLSFSPVSQTPVDLLVVVLDDEKTLHEIDDPALAAHVARREAFKEKTLKREYFATLPEGARGQGPGRLLEPRPQELEPLGEREDLHGEGAAPGPRLTCPRWRWS